jgi:DNA-binding transcriptional ArsR family regulator
MQVPDANLQAFLKALASETRQAILLLFATSEAMTVNQVAEAVGIGQSTASEHLALLRRAGLLTATREGKEVYYRPNDDQLISSAEQLLAYVKACARRTPAD